jgi:energy-coupling factor transporter ATP-binding protein EcfA2
MRVVGISLAERGPVGHAQIPIGPGLNVLYGRNGVGKTRLLDAVRRLVNQRRPPHFERSGRSPTKAFYLHGGLQLEGKFPDIGANDDESITTAWILEKALGITKQPLYHYDFDIGRLSHEPLSENRLAVLDAALRTKFGEDHAGGRLSEGEIAALIRGGRWFLVPGVVSRLYIAATLIDTTTGKPVDPALGDYWARAGKAWKEVEHDLQTGGGEAGDLAGIVGDWSDEDASVVWRGPDLKGLSDLPNPAWADPEWVALPVRWLGDIAPDSGDPEPPDEPTSSMLLRSVSESTESIQELTRRHLARAWPMAPLAGGLSVPQDAADAIGKARGRLVRAANGIFGDLVGRSTNAPKLGLKIHPPTSWLGGGSPVEWTVKFDDVPLMPIFDRHGTSALGSGHRRWAELAIRRALARTSGDNVLAVLDEPELALHESAIDHLVINLPKLGEYVLVASHSPRVLQPPANLLHVERVHGFARVRQLPDITADRVGSLAKRFGVSQATLMTMTRVLLFVEGPQDVALIKAWLNDELNAARSCVIPLQGTRGTPNIAEATWLLAATHAQIIVAIDNASRVTEIERWVRSYKDCDDALEYLKRQHTGRQKLTPEERICCNLLQVAVERGVLHRINLFGFTERDIAFYLPADRICPGFNTWAEVLQAYKAENGPLKTGGGKKFKDWINKKGGKYHERGIKMVASQLFNEWAAAGQVDARLPSDFKQLREQIERLSRVMR